jgi:hypothetical protein
MSWSRLTLAVKSLLGRVNPVKMKMCRNLLAFLFLLPTPWPCVLFLDPSCRRCARPGWPLSHVGLSLSPFAAYATRCLEPRSGSLPTPRDHVHGSMDSTDITVKSSMEWMRRRVRRCARSGAFYNASATNALGARADDEGSSGGGGSGVAEVEG